MQKPTPNGPTPGGTPGQFTPGMTEQWGDPEVVMVELPEKIDFKTPANYTDLKKAMTESITLMEQVMRKSLEDIDTCYQDYLKKMNDGFLLK